LLRVVQTPYQAPNANAHAERFVRSIKEECLDRIIPIGERHFRRAMAEFVAHYHHERNHQGLNNTLIDDRTCQPNGRRIRRASYLNLRNRSERVTVLPSVEGEVKLRVRASPSTFRTR